MSTTTVPNGTTVSNQEVTSGNTLEVQSGGTANATTVDNGGILQVDAGGTENNATVQAGGTETISGTINSSSAVTASGTSSGDQIYGTVNVGSGGAISNATIQNGGALNLTAKSASASGITVDAGGLLTINGNAPANNVTLQGGTIELESGKADSTNGTSGVPTASGSLTFASGYNSTLRIDVAQTGANGTTFSQTLSGFASGDIVDLKYLTLSGASLSQTQSGSNTVVTITGGGSSGSESFTFANRTAGSFSLAADAGSGSEVAYGVVCFCTGTLIRTGRGDVAVEHLAAGDLVATASGELRPVRWVGHRMVDCRRHPRPTEVQPVRISAHAFAESRPARDLVVSPGHALCLDVLGEVLVPASALVNGSTVQRLDVDEVTYWHIELDSHDILLAENMPAESYLDMGNRAFFAGGAVVALDASPDADPSARSHADFCRPFHHGGPLVEAVRGQLRARALSLGWRISEKVDDDLHLVADGVVVRPVRVGDMARFVVPAAARDVWLMSRSFVPHHVSDSPDGRQLGVIVQAITVDDGLGTRRDVAFDDPLLCAGFHDPEAGYRWTAGQALLPAALWDGCHDVFFLSLRVTSDSLRAWVAPDGVTLSDAPTARDLQRGLRLVHAA